MRVDRGKILRFVAWFVPIFLVLILSYPFLMRSYEPAVLGTANVVMDRLDPPTRIETTRWGYWRAFDMDRGYKRAFQSWRKDVKHLHFLSIALVPALLLATPAPWKVRLRLLAIAMPLLFGAHVLAIVGVVRTHYCYLLDPFNVTCRILLRISNTSGQLFGAALWALLTFRYWIERTPPAGRPGSEAARP